jgi:hypothetical protein
LEWWRRHRTPIILWILTLFTEKKWSSISIEGILFASHKATLRPQKNQLQVGTPLVEIIGYFFERISLTPKM